MVLLILTPSHLSFHALPLCWWLTEPSAPCILPEIHQIYSHFSAFACAVPLHKTLFPRYVFVTHSLTLFRFHSLSVIWQGFHGYAFWAKTISTICPYPSWWLKPSDIKIYFVIIYFLPLECNLHNHYSLLYSQDLE